MTQGIGMRTDEEATLLARAEAERLTGPPTGGETSWDYRYLFEAGAEWQRAQIAARRDEVIQALTPRVQAPRDRHGWSDAAREAWEHYAVNDFTEAYAAVNRVYIADLADAILAALGVSDRG